jgi:hypothetical protein
MVKKFLALAFLITGFLLAGNAYGEDEVYYCAEIGANGFTYNEQSDSYEHQSFKPHKFKLKRKLLALEIAPYKGAKQLFKCSNSFAEINEPELLFCSYHYHHFHFNTNTGRFVSFIGYGFVGGDHDGIAVKYGTCDKF